MAVDKRFLFNIFLFILTLLLSAMILDKGQHLKTSLPKSPNKPDIIMQNFELTSFNKQGEKNTLIKAEKLEHFTASSTLSKENEGLSNRCFVNNQVPVGSDVAILTHPHIQIFFPDHSPVTITSGQGLSLGQDTTIIFNHHVQLEMPSKTKGLITNHTEQLIICPKQKIAYSTQPDVLSQPGAIIDLQDFTLDLKTRTISSDKPTEASFTNQAIPEIKQELQTR